VHCLLNKVLKSLSFFSFSDTSTADERLPLSFSLHYIRKCIKQKILSIITRPKLPSQWARSDVPMYVLFQDLETFDLEDFKYNSVNITSFRIVDDENHRVVNVLREMERFQRVGQNMLHKSGIIRVINNYYYRLLHYHRWNLPSDFFFLLLLLLEITFFIMMYLMDIFFYQWTLVIFSQLLCFIQKLYLYSMKDSQKIMKKCTLI